MKTLEEFSTVVTAMTKTMDNLIVVCKAAPVLDQLYKKKITVDQFCDWLDENGQQIENLEWTKDWFRNNSFETKRGSNSVWEAWFDVDNIMQPIADKGWYFSEEYMCVLEEEITQVVESTKRTWQ